MSVSRYSCDVGSNSEDSRTENALLEYPLEGSFRPTVFDRRHALSRLGGLEDVLFDVMELMTIESTRVHAEIAPACTHRDSIELKRSAHTLKGAVSIVGAADLVTRLKRVEDFAAASEFEQAAHELPEIDRQFAELQFLLAVELKNKP